VPNFSIEGEQWFRDRDEAATRAAVEQEEPEEQEEQQSVPAG